jgi:CheY-like chemotaxis protein
MCSILLVEDHSDTRRAFAGLLESWGHQVSTRDSATGGLAFLDENEVDVILSDIGLPDQDGYDFISQVRQHDCGVIAIAVSAYFTGADRSRAHDAGFDMYYAKPVDLIDLQSALSRVNARLGRNARHVFAARGPRGNFSSAAAS